jgi:hypothetical protein
LNFKKGINKLKINTAQLANGQYQYRLIIDGLMQKVDKIVILHK